MNDEGGNGGDHPVGHHLSFQLFSDDGGGCFRVDHHLPFRVFNGDGGCGGCRVDHHLSLPKMKEVDDHQVYLHLSLPVAKGRGD